MNINKKYCELNTTNNSTDTWISTAFIRDRGYPTIFNESFPDSIVNNPPAINVFVHLGPSKKNPLKLVFYINNLEQPRLLLSRNKKYQFNVNTRGYPFYFTTDSIGGKGNYNNITNIIPSDYFKTTFLMDDNLSGQFYYQCALYPEMGGKVLLL